MSHLILQTPTTKLNSAGTLTGLWYPSARPLQIWRKTLGTTWEENAAAPLGECNVAQPVLSTPLKYIKKQCDSCSPGSIISFSGYSGIKSADANFSKGYLDNSNTFVRKHYFPNNHQYLRNRGNTFDTASTFHKIQGVNYVSGTNPVWPVTAQTAEGVPVTSASFAHNAAICNPTKFLIFKPNNPGFSTQGAVDSSTRLWKLKYAERPELTQFQKKALRAQLKK